MNVVEMKPAPKPKPPVQLDELRCLPPDPETEELRSFLHVLYRALKMITKYLERTYGF